MPVKKQWLSIFPVLIVLILLIPACAVTEQQPQAGLFFMQTVNEDDLRSINILILSDMEINKGVSAIIIAAAGNINVSAPVDGMILTLFTKSVSTANVKYGIIDLKSFSLPFNIIIGLGMLAVFKDFMEQAAAYLEKNKRGSLKLGFYGYIMALLLIGIFFISIAGAMIAAAGILALAIVTLAGHVPVSIVLGFRLREKLRSYNIYILFVIGSVIIDLIIMLPVAGDIIRFFIMPVLSLGTFSVYLIHSRFYKAYVLPDFEKSDKYDRGKIKSIILRSID